MCFKSGDKVFYAMLVLCSTFMLEISLLALKKDA